MASLANSSILGGVGRRLVAALDAWSYSIAKAHARQRHRKAMQKAAKHQSAKSKAFTPTPWKD